MENLPIPIPYWADREWTHSTPGFSEDQKTTYVTHIRKGFRRYKSAEVTGVPFSTIQYHLQADPVFRKMVLDAEQAKLDEVEEAMYSTAIMGNVPAQQTILYNRRPEEWADQRSIRDRELVAQQQAELAAMQGDTSELEKLKAIIDGLTIQPVVIDMEDNAPA